MCFLVLMSQEEITFALASEAFYLELNLSRIKTPRPVANQTSASNQTLTLFSQPFDPDSESTWALALIAVSRSHTCCRIKRDLHQRSYLQSPTCCFFWRAVLWYSDVKPCSDSASWRLKRSFALSNRPRHLFSNLGSSLMFYNRLIFGKAAWKQRLGFHSTT